MKYVNLYKISASISKHTYTLTGKREHTESREPLFLTSSLWCKKTMKHKIAVVNQNQYSGHGYLVLLINYFCSDQCYLFMSKATQNGRGKKACKHQEVLRCSQLYQALVVSMATLDQNYLLTCTQLVVILKL